MGKEQSPKSQKWLFVTTHPKMHQPEGIPANPGSNNSLPGLQGRTAMESPGIYTGLTILGQKGQSAKAWSTTPFCKMHPQVEAGNEAFYHFYWWHGPRGNNTQVGNSGGVGQRTRHDGDPANPYARKGACHLAREADQSTSWWTGNPGCCFGRASWGARHPGCWFGRASCLTSWEARCPSYSTGDR